jgi:hypothetical protein
VQIPFAFAAIALGACNAVPAPTPAPTSAPPVALSPAPVAVTTASAAPIAAAPQELPRFLSLGADPEKDYPWRAVLRRNGPAYEERGGPVANDADGRPMRRVVPVLDPDEGTATAMRPARGSRST